MTSQLPEGIQIIAGVRHGCFKSMKMCEGSFECATCRQKVGYCLGGEDDHPEDCADCWDVKVEAEADQHARMRRHRRGESYWHHARRVRKEIAAATRKGDRDDVEGFPPSCWTKETEVSELRSERIGKWVIVPVGAVRLKTAVEVSNQYPLLAQIVALTAEGFEVVCPHPLQDVRKTPVDVWVVTRPDQVHHYSGARGVLLAETPFAEAPSAVPPFLPLPPELRRTLKDTIDVDRSRQIQALESVYKVAYKDMANLRERLENIDRLTEIQARFDQHYGPDPS